MRSPHSSCHAALTLTLIVCCVATLQGAPAWPEKLASQEGLPRELVIAEQPALTEQVKVLRGLALSAQEYAPKGGILSGFRSLFGGGEKTRYVTLEALAEHAAEIRGEFVRVEGIYEAEGERGVVRSEGHKVIVALAGGVVPEGFDAAGGQVNGLPVAAQGTVETESDTAVVRATLLVPSLTLVQLRIGRILELQDDYRGAMEAYLKVANNSALSRGPLAPFARCRAAQIAFEELRDEKAARKHYSAAWQPYTVTGAEGEPLYYTWTPVAGGADAAQTQGGGWQKVSARDAIAERLDSLNAGGFFYRVVEFFVALGGSNAALGILIMAVVVRAVIFPLTRKQLDSQRRMQKIQPQIKELQKRLGNDKQKFQEEFWQLCKDNKCNPLGGCLPMLVQMPILIFLYRGIRDYVVRFDGTSFLWVPNLAQPDIILLVAYTLSMIAFQKMVTQNQPAADAQQQQQQKMMAYMMPIMFFFFFQGFPAAFILYWLATNVIYFAEQWLFLRKSRNEEGEGQEQAAACPAGGGFVARMVQALSKHEEDGDERPASYEEKRKQANKPKRAKR